MNIKTIKLPHKVDARGWLTENTDPELKACMEHFFIASSHPSAIRGQHNHRKKKEWFLILKGKEMLFFVFHYFF